MGYGLCLREIVMGEEEKAALGLTSKYYTSFEIALCSQFKVFRRDSEDEYVRKITLLFSYAVGSFDKAMDKKYSNKIRLQLKNLCYDESDNLKIEEAMNRVVDGKAYLFRNRRDIPKEELKIALLVANKQESDKHPLYVSYKERSTLLKNSGTRRLGVSIGR